jgi:hypothetical protein
VVVSFDSLRIQENHPVSRGWRAVCRLSHDKLV